MRKPINAQTPTITKQMSAATVQAPAATKQIHTTTTKPLPIANVQTPATINQMHTATAQTTATLASSTCKPSANQALIVTVGSIMLGIVRPSKKAQKARNLYQN
ncbi:hypothetical protein DSO57_1020316 [Entomophthora muscae]|uniref:Uncharacterized protein n=1 Tax=Entomophthora muscae TaxID=34485 RepID=A0ACC2TR37_9FUNG|nr:hypothetical protein DSO57_1020316 [Entomophthora muscae]